MPLFRQISPELRRRATPLRHFRAKLRYAAAAAICLRRYCALDGADAAYC